MAKKTVNYNKTGTEKLPNDKPVIYKIKTDGGKTNYTGAAKKGRVRERIQEHLDDGLIPGVKVQIEQVATIAEAKQKEKRAIVRTKPKYNKQGK